MRLILLRHAEAAQDEALRDLDRPLTRAGRLTAEALGERLRAEGLDAARVWCSPALRTRETVAALGEGLGRALAPELKRRIYLATAEELLDLLHEDEAGGDLMLVGHNPGLHALAAALAAPDDPVRAALADGGYAPCTLLRYELPAASGRGIAPATGRADRFIPPGAA